MPMRDRHRRLLQTSVEAARACYPTVRVGVLCAVGFASALFGGCGGLAPMREPEVVDLELTTDTLKATVRDAQRTVLDLRNDLEARRRELAETQVARAQLEGRVREAERRVAEARQIIELQREELAAARTERERVFRSSLHLRSQIKQLQRQLSKVGTSGPAHDGQEATPLPSNGEIRKGEKAVQAPAQRDLLSEFHETPRMVATSIPVTPVPANRPLSSQVGPSTVSTRYVSVKPGDTLWSISRRYRVDLEQLRALNQVTDNRIVIGQTLWLPDDQSISGAGADKDSLMP